MVAATLLWGATFVAARDVLRHIGPAELVFARFTAATVAFAGLALGIRSRSSGRDRERGRTTPEARRAAWVGGVVSGVLGAGSYLFQAIGLTRTSAGSSAFLTCVGTGLAALLAWPLLRQRPSGALLQGLLIAVAGSFLMSAGPGLRIGTGEAWTLVGAALFALQIVVLGHWAPRAEALPLAGVQAGALALTLCPYAGRAAAALGRLDGPDTLRFAYLALAGSVAGPLLQVSAQRSLPPGRVALLFALEPVFALLFALTLGGERFALRWWIGALLILCGVLRVEWRGRAGGS